MDLPKVNMRMVLRTGITAVEVEEKWIPVPPSENDEDDDIVTEVTVLARDLEEGVWTVWDHTSLVIRLVSFDENGNWSWIDVADEIVNDQN